MRLKRTNSSDLDFIALVDLLNADLAKKDGAKHAYYARFNGIDMLRNVVVAYQENKAVGCGAFKVFEENISVEIKRMYVLENSRGKGIATFIINELEQWARELDYTKMPIRNWEETTRGCETLYKKRL